MTSFVRPDEYILVEFYASWCPFCKNFRRQYDALGGFFNTDPRPKPHVTVARVDCNDYASLCKDYEIKSYPTIYLGRADSFASIDVETLISINPIDVKDADDIPQALVARIGAAIGRLGHSDPVIFDEETSSHLEERFVFGATTSPKKKAAEEKTGSVPTTKDPEGHHPAGGGVAEPSDDAEAKGRSRAQAEVAAASSRGAPLWHSRSQSHSHHQRRRRRQVDVEDLILATAMSVRHMQKNPSVMVGPQARTSFINWVNVLGNYHPVRVCAEAFTKLAEDINHTVWPVTSTFVDWHAFKTYDGCGPDVAWEEWGDCRGSSLEEYRGYTCGFWGLLHTLSVRVPDQTVPNFVRALAAWMQTYFGCKSCGDHFAALATSEESGGGGRVRTQSENIMWLWKTHNLINRLTAATADPEHPKIQWPPASLCPGCRAKGHAEDTDESPVWVETKVLAFLRHYYRVPADAEHDPTGTFVQKVRKQKEEEAMHPRSTLRGYLGRGGHPGLMARESVEEMGWGARLGFTVLLLGGVVGVVLFAYSTLRRRGKTGWFQIKKSHMG